MFTIDDLWRIMKYLKDGTTSTKLSELTTTLATSEKEIVNTLFENILDQQTFSSDDYRRLRSMLIDWYASHRTIATTQRYASDVHQLPNSHLSELFKSFGFPIGLDLVPLTTKANFFLDLVNFYKKKGTPETIVDVLDYYGYSDSDLVEYWLQKDQYGNLIFRAESVREAATGSTLLLDTDVPFEKLTENDPHWFQSKDDIEALLLTNKINLPSKSPYYSLTSIFSLSSLILSLSIVFRIIQDQFDRYLSGLSLPYDVPIKNLGLLAPLLHLYVGTIYAFERMFGYGVATQFSRYGCYTGDITYIGDPPSPDNLSSLIDEYEDLIARPTSRIDRDERLVELINNWTRPIDENFLNVLNAAEPLLEALNPDLKAVIDTWFDINNESYLITYLIGSIDNWIRLNIDSKSPSLVITMLGLGFREELDAILNFFKPYRARLAYMDTAYSIKNPLTESVILDEKLITEIQTFQHDHIRPPGGYCPAISYPYYPDGDPSSFDLHQILDDAWKWDVGKFFDSPPRAPEEIIDSNPYLKFLLCSDWTYDIGKNYDSMPTHNPDFGFDKGGFFDLLPSLQKCLMTIVNNHPDGGMCDYFEIDIETQYHDKVAYRRVFNRNFDTGAQFDLGYEIQWLDNATISQQEDFKEDVIEVTDEAVIDEEVSFIDTFGEEPPMQMDLGHSYDTLYPKAAVSDYVHIDISSVGSVTISSNVGRYPTNYDTGSNFDRITDLFIRHNVNIYGTVSATTSLGTYPTDYDTGSSYDTITDLIITHPEISFHTWLETTLNISSSVGPGEMIFLTIIPVEYTTNEVISSTSIPNLELGIIEILESTSSSIVNILSSLRVGIFVSTITAQINISEPTLESVFYLESTVNAVSSIDVDLSTGSSNPEELKSSAIINVDVYNPELIIGVEYELTANSSITFSADANLTRGIVELLSSSYIITSQTSSLESFGVDELLSSSISINSNIMTTDLIHIITVYQPRGIVFDFEDNHGDTLDMAVMGIRFYRDGEVYDIGTPGVDYTAYASSTAVSGLYAPWRAFFDSSPLTGTVNNWASDEETTNQRLICNIGIPLPIDGITFYNYHASGTNTDRGVKNVKIYFSNDIISNTIYGSPVPNSVMVFDGVISEHSSVDELDPQILTIYTLSSTVTISSECSSLELESDVVSATGSIISNTNALLSLGVVEVSSGISISHIDSIAEMFVGTNETLTAINNITTSVVSELYTDETLSSSVVSTSDCIGDIIVGDNESLTAINTVYSSFDGVLVIGDNEALTSSINVNSDINAYLVEAISSSISITADVSSNTIETGVSEILSGISNIGVAIITVPSLDIVVSSAITISSTIDSILVTGDNEELTSSISLTSATLADITAGENEILSGSSNCELVTIIDLTVV